MDATRELSATEKADLPVPVGSGFDRLLAPSASRSNPIMRSAPEARVIHRLRVRGKFACFTRPEFKTERLSYEVITPSAARGILDAILWKPAIRWHVVRISLLAPTQFIQFKRNEVTTRISVRNALTAASRSEPLDFFIDDDRAQRNTIALRDVDYAIEAECRLTQRAAPDENLRKFDEMFRRRLRKGQFHTQPYLGCREFPCDVEPYVGVPGPITTANRDLGNMLQDIRFNPGGNKPIFFRARLERGIIEIPQLDLTE